MYLPISEMKDPCTIYRENFLPTELNSMNSIVDQVEFNTEEESKVMIYGRRIAIPRQQSAYGDKDLSYKFSGLSVAARDWSTAPLLKRIRNYIRDTLNVPVNFVLVN